MAGPFVVDRNQVVIGAPAKRVFDYLADITRHGEWNQDPGYRERILTDGPLGLGSVLRREKDGVMRGPLLIRGGMGDNLVRVVKTTTVTGYEPHAGLVFETSNSYNGLLVSKDKLTFHLQEEMEGTRVTMVSEVEAMVPGGFMGPVYAIRVVRAVFERLLGKWLKSLSPRMPVGPFLPRIKEAVEKGNIAAEI